MDCICRRISLLYGGAAQIRIMDTRYGLVYSDWNLDILSGEKSVPSPDNPFDNVRIHEPACLWLSSVRDSKI